MKNSTGNYNQSRSASAAVAQKDFSNDLASEIAAALSSRFDPLGLVGASQNAFYYLGCDLLASAQNELVKIKVFSCQTADESKQLELFNLEARSAARLSHSNILRAGPPENLNGIHFSIIEHGVGVETLSRALDRNGWLDLKLAVEIARQIADALDHAHKLGVLHLRIQPDNILLDQQGAALVADFGLEAGDNLQWAHKERALLSDAHYISPELIEGKAADARSDLYSLGLVLYKMLTDRLPFDAEDSDEIKQKHLRQAPLPLHLYCPDIPPRLSALINCLLEKDPERRLRSASDLRAALDYLASSHLNPVKQNLEQLPQAVDTGGADRSAGATSSSDEISEPSKERPEKSVHVDSPPLEQWSERVAHDDGRKRQTLLWLLVVGLALAVTTGLIVISRRGHIENASKEQTPLIVPVEEKTNEHGDAKTPPPATDDSTSAVSPPGPAPQRLDAGMNIAKQRTGASVTPRSTRKRFIRSSTPRRTYQPKYQPKRKSWRFWRFGR